MKLEQSVPKRRRIKFNRRGITQQKEHNIQNTASVWNQELSPYLINRTLKFILNFCEFYVGWHINCINFTGQFTVNYFEQWI